MSDDSGWPALFNSAFRQSRNAMLLLDEQRRMIDANAALVQLIGRRQGELVGRPIFELVAGGPLATADEWRDALASGRFAGEATLLHSDGSEIGVQWGATTEVVTGRRLVLFVVLATSRWGSRFRRPLEPDAPTQALSARERQVVHLVALGKTGPEIADELGVTHQTVRTHVRNAMGKASARSRAHLVAKALGDELIA